MKIFIVTRAPFPIGTSTTGRIICYSKGIIANNVRCEVVTTSQKESKTVDISVPYKKICKNRHSSTIKFYKLIEGIISIFRNYNYLKSKVNKNDIIFVYGDNIFDSISYWCLAYFHNKLLVKELCEIPFLNNNFINVLKRWIQTHFFFKMYHGFVSISDDLINFALKYKSDNAIIIKIPVLFDSSLLNGITVDKSIDFKYIFHAGGLTEEKDGIHTSLTAFGIAFPKLNVNVKFVIAGINRWKYSKKILDIISEYHLEKHIIFLDFLEPQDLIVWSLKSDLCIVYKNDNIQNRNGFATKIADALSCETAIITTTVGEPKKYLTDGHSAYIIDPKGPEGLAQKIIQALSNPDERLKIAYNGKQIAKNHFDNVIQGKKLVSFFMEVIHIQLK